MLKESHGVNSLIWLEVRRLPHQNTTSKTKKPAKSSKGANYLTSSIVEFFQSIKQPFRFNTRKKLANSYGVSRGKYSGKANENAELLKRVKSNYKKTGKLNGMTSNSKKKSSNSKSTLPTGILRVGNRGEKVRQLQRALNKANYKVGKVDGIYSKKTKDAITRFQKVHDAFNVDGIYGSRTRSRLSKLI